jgi:hypothetical protein
MTRSFVVMVKVTALLFPRRVAKMPNRARLATYLFIFAALLLTSRLFQANAASNDPAVITGERFSFSVLPRWTYSGIWEPTSSRLLLVDAISSRIRIYNDQGLYLGNVKDESSGQDFSNPIKVGNASPLSFWLEDDDGRFLLLDSTHRVLQSRDVEAAAKGGPNGDLTGIYQWASTGSDLLLFGDVRKDGSAVSAFIKLSTDTPREFQILDRIGLEDPSRRFYLVGAPYLASINSKPYFFVMADIPFISTPEGNKIYFLQTDPSGKKSLIRRPTLPVQKGLSASRQVFQVLQESTMVSGIYSWNNYLYALMRSPSTQGRTAWSLLKIDPTSPKNNWTRLIDSTADHLTVIPGEKYWAFIEKGPVEAPGQQRIASFLRVPAERLAGN